MAKYIRRHWSLLVSVIIFLAQAYILRQFSIDDAAISYRYTQHLADGLGLTWNPGQPPVEGYSNFLWVLFLAGGRWLGIDIEALAKIAGICLGGMTLVLLHFLVRRLWEESGYRWLPAMLVSVCPVWTIWVVSGLELASFSFFLMFLLFGMTSSRWRRTIITSVALGGLFFSRPEGIALAGVFLVGGFFGERGVAIPQRARRYGIPAVFLLFCVIALLLFRLSYYGYPFANTVYAKFSTDLPAASEVGKWLFFGLPFLAAFFFAIQRPPTSRHRMILGVALALIIAQMMLVLPVSPVMYFLHRYQISFLPLLILAIPPVLDQIAEKRRHLATILVVFAILWTVQHWPEVYKRYKTEVFYYQQHKLVVEQLNSLPGRPTIALMDAGRIPYWSDLPATDAWGLCDARIAREGFSPAALWQGQLGAPDVYIMSIKSRMSLDYGKTDLIPLIGFDKLIAADPHFQDNYRLWYVVPDDTHYGYAIMLQKQWADRNNVILPEYHDYLLWPRLIGNR